MQLPKKKSVPNRAAILFNLYPKDVFIDLVLLSLHALIFDKNAVLNGVTLVHREQCFLGYF